MVWGDLFFWPFGAAAGVIYILFGMIVLVFIIWMVIDCIQRNFRVEAEKWIWLVLIIITKGIGAVAYYIAVKVYNPKGIAKK